MHDDDATPGLQPACVATQVTDVDALLPECDNLADPPASTNLPCHVLSEDHDRCPLTDSGLRVDVLRIGDPPAGELVGECLVDG